MKERLSLFVFSLFIASIACAQERYEVGIEGGPIHCYYRIRDPQDNLVNVSCVSGVGGVNFRYNSRKKIFYEAGFLLSEYTMGFKLRQQDGYFNTNHDAVLFIPLRVGYPLRLSKRLSFVPSIGLTTAVKTLSGDGSSGGYMEGSGDGFLAHEYSFRYLGKNVFFLVNGNAAFEWTFAKRLKATWGIQYYQGVSEHTLADVEYKVANAPVQMAELAGNGSFIGFSAGFKYLIK